jgi:hypothetical protein
VFWNIIIGIASFFLNLVLAPKPQNAKPASLADFNIPVAEEGVEIPVVFGTVNIRNPNCVWYGDLGIQAIKGAPRYGLFGPKQVTGHRYALGLHMVLCHGVHDEILEIWAGEKLIYPKLPSTLPVTGSAILVIDQFDIFGGDEGDGGIQGAVVILDGNPEQGSIAYLEAQLAGRHTCFSRRGQRCLGARLYRHQSLHQALGIFSQTHPQDVGRRNPVVRRQGGGARFAHVWWWRRSGFRAGARHLWQ